MDEVLVFFFLCSGDELVFFVGGCSGLWRGSGGSVGTLGEVGSTNSCIHARGGPTGENCVFMFLFVFVFLFFFGFV